MRKSLLNKKKTKKKLVLLILISSFEILNCTELLISKIGLVGIPVLWVLGRPDNFGQW